ncbi:hypothetical protein FXN61_37330 [Lentzea sp. PSKA42]|jgi:hypothetical protein|uniref:Peptidase inhibitor family I36 n=1 Tax=Lentzea indica TaxID=2604800 RepID=A0ABX1FST0_9PSEU|nr:hypothetical protein [Lentzea indica]NKE62109.1 hypothetical protein [Lentzea indica]
MRTLHKFGLAAAAVVFGLTGTLTATASAQPEVEVAAAPADCPKYYFCGYRKANYKELAFKYKDCYLQKIPTLFSGGSWYNNQSRGTQARMYDINKKHLYTTPGAPSKDPTANWLPVWYVDAC